MLFRSAARERFQLAINQLQQGDATHAAVELKAYLAEVPNSAPAKNMLTQIETPIEMLYPLENFTVQLGRDETLSSLAGVYLGDVLGFYGLARYNNIENPSRVVAGQNVKIPRTPQTLAAQTMRTSMAAMQQQASTTPPPQARPPVATPPATPTPTTAPRPAPPRDPWTTIRQNVTAGRFEAAIREAETSRVMPDAAQAVVLASAYAGNAKAIRMSNAMQAGAQAFRAGQLYLEPANRPEDALDPLQLAVAINPNDGRAQMLLTTAKGRAADTYYRNGVAAFQKQDLDGAIAAWDKALATIKEYNAAVMKDVPFNPNIKDGRGTKGLSVPKSNWANTVDEPPFEAYAVTCGVTFTFGGLKIDNDGRVVDTDGHIIPGLHAAGELVGGLFYFNYPGGTGLMAGSVFGRIAGTTAGKSAAA